MNQTNKNIAFSIRKKYQDMGIPVLSYSSLTLYDGCPYCYYLKYICGVQQKWISGNLILGTIVHKILEDEKIVSKPEQLNKLIDSEIEYNLRNKYLKGTSKAKIKNDANKMAMLIKNNPMIRENGEEFKFKEIEYEGFKAMDCGYPENSLVIHSKIDAISDKDELIERKTSAMKWTEETIKNSHQHVIYSMVVGNLLHNKVIYDILYKTANPIREQIIIDVTEEDVKRTKEWIMVLGKNIINQVWKPYKKIGWQHRQWCDHKNLCPYCSKP